MSTDLVSFGFQNHGVRVTAKGGTPWFIAKDVCDILEISNSRDAVASLDDDEKDTVVITDGTAGNPNHTVVSESGLFALIFKAGSENLP